MGENVKRFANDRNPNGLGYSNGVVEDEHGHYVLHSDYEAIARQAEALQRENAELREVLADSLSAFRCTQNVDRYPADHWCRRARALLGGENAGN